MNAIELSLFSNRISAVCDEMGAVLQKAAFSPNIRDRLDFSCAVFDAKGELAAQAAHIPVHLGSMAYAMRDLVRQLSWSAGDMLVVNDPYLGGTHLPDVTVIAPVFVEQRLQGFVANRAHHADIGADTPGSMPISASLDEEGIVISPTYIVRNGQLIKDEMDKIVGVMRNRQQGQGDFAAQISANHTGVARLSQLIMQLGAEHYAASLQALNDYAQRLALNVLNDIPDGRYEFTDYMDDDGLGNQAIPIHVSIEVKAQRIDVDFTGTAPQTRGNINCPLSVAAAAVFYVFRCLMPDYTPACWGSFRPIRLKAPEGSLLNARWPAAVAAGNVETSTRVVDVIMGALAQAIPERIPSASYGSMNNLAMGGDYQQQPWDYYETIGGGLGAGPRYDGQSTVQAHMTNTRNTPIEVLESHYPLRIRRYAVRDNSGGAGQHVGGNGIIREFEFLAPATVTILSERCQFAPWALGGAAGQSASHRLNGKVLAAKSCFTVNEGDCLTLMSAGGGGWSQH